MEDKEEKYMVDEWVKLWRVEDKIYHKRKDKGALDNF